MWEHPFKSNTNCKNNMKTFEKFDISKNILLSIFLP